MGKSARNKRGKSGDKVPELRAEDTNATPEKIKNEERVKPFGRGVFICGGILVLGAAAFFIRLWAAPSESAKNDAGKPAGLSAKEAPVTPSGSTAPAAINIGKIIQADAKPSTAPTQTTAVQPAIPQLLAEANKALNPRSFGFVNIKRATMIRAELDDKKKVLDPLDRRNLEILYSKELLNGGKTEAALAAYRANMLELKQNAPELYRQTEVDSLIFEAICNLRLGEQLNCCARNNQNSCLVPISGEGIHSKQEGSRGAVKCLMDYLSHHPTELTARWLLNIAHMTLGEYPDKVPPQFVIPLKNYGGDFPMKKFINAAPQLGLDHDGWAGSIIIEDFQGNGLLDLVVSSWHIEGQLRYIRNNGDGTFTDRTKEMGLPGEVGGLNMITTDYNNDGRPDIVVLRGGWFGGNGMYPLSLLRNDGDGHFTNVTLEAGLLTRGPTQTAVAFDYNGDGFLDLFVGYEADKSVSVPCKLFRNKGDGTFADVTKQDGLVIQRFVKGAVSADFMRSGRPGLYLSCLDGTNILIRNDGPAGEDKSPSAPWKFEDATPKGGVSSQSGSFSCFFFDYNNDGWPDLYVNGYAGNRSLREIAKDYLGQPSATQKAKLYRNNRDGTFADVSKEARLDKAVLGMGLNFGDLDNDGWLDFYVGTGSPELEMLLPNRMFRNNDGTHFDEVTTTGDFGHLQKGHGISFADLDNNGQQDIFLVAGGAFEGDTAHDCFFVNPGSTNHWLTLKLTGVKSNRIALGAEICVTVETPKGDRQIYKTVSTGGSFGNNPLRQEIGLGNATAIKQVSIRWPASGIQQVLTNLKMDSFYKIREGDKEAELWNVPTFKYKLEPVPATPDQK